MTGVPASVESASGVRVGTVEFAGFAAVWFRRIMGAGTRFNGVRLPIGGGPRLGLAPGTDQIGLVPRNTFDGRRPNQSLQQTKPPVTSLAGASAAPAVFAAEARC